MTWRKGLRILGVFANLTLPDRRDSCHPNKISWTIWLLKNDQVRLNSSHNKWFWLLGRRPSLNSETIRSRIRLRCMLICAAFKSYIEWSNEQQNSTNYYNTTNHSANSIGHVIYTPQTRTSQNITKLMTHPSSSWYASVYCKPIWSTIFYNQFDAKDIHSTAMGSKLVTETNRCNYDFWVEG